MPAAVPIAVGRALDPGPDRGLLRCAEPALKIAARFVAEHPHRVAMRSLRHVASAAGFPRRR